MKWLRICSFVVLLVGLFLAPCRLQADGMTTQTYLPLDAGTVWTCLENGQQTVTRSVAAQAEMINGIQTKAVQYNGGQLPNRQENYANGNDGLTVYRIHYTDSSGQHKTVRFDTPLKMAPATMIPDSPPILIDGTATVRVENSSGWVEIPATYQATSKIAQLTTVVVPAGTFTAIQLERTVNVQAMDQSRSITSRFWLAQGVGIVKEVSNVGNIVTTTELVTAHYPNLLTGSVTITGLPMEGQILTATHTLEDGSGMNALYYQWQANGVPLTGATNTTLLLTQNQLGKTITALVGYTDVHNRAKSVTSQATRMVVNNDDSALRIAAPSVSGPNHTKDGMPTWSWHSASSRGSGTFRVKLDQDDLTVGATETRKNSFTPGSVLSIGTHTLYVQERNLAGVWSLSGSWPIQVDPPGANWTVIKIPEQIKTLDTAQFFATLTVNGVPTTRYEWEFGDGSTATGNVVRHTFQQPGRYAVTLQAVNPNGQSTTQTFMVDVEEARLAVSGTISGIKSGDLAQVLAFSPSLGASRVILVQGNGATIPFTIADLPPAADYRLQIQSPNNPDGYWGGILNGPAAAPVGWLAATPIEVTKNNVTGVHWQLATGYTLTVTVTGTHAGDLLEITAWSQQTNGLDWQQVAASGDSVQVVLTGLPSANDYVIAINSPSDGVRDGFYTGEQHPPGPYLQAARVAVTTNQNRTMTATSGYRISGTLSNLTAGNEARVTAWSADTFTLETITLTNNGPYTLAGLVPAQDYAVCVEIDRQAGGCYGGAHTDLTSRRLALPVDLRQGAKTGIDLVAGHNRTITGRVFGLTTGETAWVEAWSTSMDHWTIAQVQTDGRFELTGLRQAADYRVTVAAEGYQNTLPILVDLNNSMTSVANFNLSKGGTIQGTITGLVAGEVASVEVRSLAVNDSQETILTAVAATPLAYTVTGLMAADDYRVTLRTNKGVFYYSALTGAKRSWGEATSLTIPDKGYKNGIDFDVTTAVSYTLSGTITGLAATPAQAGDANLVVTITAWTESSLASTIRMGNGPWSLSGLPAGNYHVTVAAPGYIKQVYAGRADGSAQAWSARQDQGTTLTVAGTLSGLNVPLTTGYTLTGTLTNSNGMAVPGVYVSAWNADQAVGDGVTTRSDGSFAITGLPGGLYRVAASTTAGRMQHSLTLFQDSALGTLPLTKAAGTIRGTTTAGSLVFVYDAAKQFVGVTVANNEGIYKVDGLALDQVYRVDVDSDGNFDTMEWSSNATPTTTTPTATLDLK